MILLQGRVHCYEGYSMREVTFPVRVLGMMGVRQYVATNASSRVNPELAPGDIAGAAHHHIFWRGKSEISVDYRRQHSAGHTGND